MPVTEKNYDHMYTSESNTANLHCSGKLVDIVSIRLEEEVNLPNKLIEWGSFTL